MTAGSAEEIASRTAEEDTSPPARGEKEYAFSPDLLQEQEGCSEEKRESLYQIILKMSIPAKIRLAMLGNREARNILIREKNKVVPQAVLRSPRLTENDVLMYAQQRNLDEEIFAVIGQNKKWMQNYPIKLALASNAKAPLSLVLKLLDHLHDRDLAALARSKNVSSVVSRAARRITVKRSDKK